MASNNLLDEMIQATEPSSTNVALNMPSTLNQLISQNYPQQEFRDLDAQNLKSQEHMDTIMSIVEGVTTGNIPLPIARVLWKGISKWIPKSMVKEGRFVAPEGSKYSIGVGKEGLENWMYTSPSKQTSQGYAVGYAREPFFKTGKIPKNSPLGQLLKFDIPDSKLNEMEALGELIKDAPHAYIFKKGIPKEYFVKLETPKEYPGLGSYKEYYKMLSEK